MSAQGSADEEAALTLGASRLADLLARDAAQHPLGPALRRAAMQRPGDGRVRRGQRRLRSHSRRRPTPCRCTSRSSTMTMTSSPPSRLRRSSPSSPSSPSRSRSALEWRHRRRARGRATDMSISVEQVSKSSSRLPGARRRLADRARQASSWRCSALGLGQDDAPADHRRARSARDGQGLVRQARRHPRQAARRAGSASCSSIMPCSAI